MPLPQQLVSRRVLVDDGEHCVPARTRTQFAQTKCVGHREQNYPDFPAPFHVQLVKPWSACPRAFGSSGLMVILCFHSRIAVVTDDVGFITCGTRDTGKTARRHALAVDALSV